MLSCWMIIQLSVAVDVYFGTSHHLRQLRLTQALIIWCLFKKVMGNITRDWSMTHASEACKDR